MDRQDNVSDTQAAEATEGGESRRIVNLVELAFVLDISTKALTEQIRQDPEFPVEERGSHGVPYKFDLDKVLPHREEKRREKDAAEHARREELRQWQLDLYGEAPEADQGITPRERIALADAVTKEDYNRKIRNELLEKWRVAEKLRKAFGRMQKGFRQIAPEFARELGLERPQRIALDAMIRETVNATIDEVQALLRTDDDDEDGDASANAA